MRPFRLLLAALALGLVATACTDKGLGSETNGQSISSYLGATNVVKTPSGDRDFRPSWSGTDFDGNVISAASVRGSVTVVNFWASWCGPCYSEQENLEAVWKRYRDRGVRFIGVNIRDTKAAARSFIRDADWTFPSIFNRDSRLACKFRTLFVPTTYVLDGRGYVAAKILGAVASEASLSGILDEELSA
jgi:thiol-disulfide isomerase/thioredoxin